MKQMKVLLVDDEESFVKTLSERLKMRDLENEVAFDGEQAVTLANGEEPDVMVLDLKMPGIDGIEVLRRVRQQYPHIQVIILTGHGTDRDEEEVRRLGAYDYLQKPIPIDDLVVRIRSAYKRKLELTMAAAAFAEAGEPEMAKEFLKGN